MFKTRDAGNAENDSPIISDVFRNGRPLSRKYSNGRSLSFG
ncbi:uncharacterized protein BCN122_II1006 [Burkholderia cenocepacia]|nr:uncharacterized protein BCN122_II1006 [Burkholderia cenocepacia]